MFNCQTTLATIIDLWVVCMQKNPKGIKHNQWRNDCLQSTSEQVSNLDAETICLVLLTLSNGIIAGVQRFWLLNLLFTFQKFQKSDLMLLICLLHIKNIIIHSLHIYTKFKLIKQIFQLFSQMLLHQHLKSVVIKPDMHRIKTYTE